MKHNKMNNGRQCWNPGNLFYEIQKPHYVHEWCQWNETLYYQILNNTCCTMDDPKMHSKVLIFL